MTDETFFYTGKINPGAFDVILVADPRDRTPAELCATIDATLDNIVEMLQRIKTDLAYLKSRDRR